MALAEERIAQTLLTGVTQQAIYTVPAATCALVNKVIITNSGSVGETVELWMGAGSEITQRIIPPMSVPASGIVTLDGGVITLNPADKITGRALSASVINIYIGGAKVT